MFRFILGMTIGWMTFTEEGKKTANSLVSKVVGEVKKSLKDTGILDDVQKTDTGNTGS